MDRGEVQKLRKKRRELARFASIEARLSQLESRLEELDCCGKNSVCAREARD